MKRTEFFFNLPDELIAQNPSGERGGSRLLVLNRTTGELTHTQISDLKNFIPDDTLLIFNNSRVRKARVYAESEFGGKVELVFIRPVFSSESDLDKGDSINSDEESAGAIRWEVLCSKAKKQTIGKKLLLPGGVEVVVESIIEDTPNRIVKASIPLDENWFEIQGHIPLPPYIKREDSSEDATRYQTVYSSETGSVAAPTAGLHFTDELINSLNDPSRGIETAEVTLHVGLGTFLPVRSDLITDHKMHREYYHVPVKTAQKVNEYKKAGKNILAVGTTSVRTLESAAIEGKLQAGYGDTNIFIYPGYEFKLVNRLFTNFHTPESTLLMLVSAFAGKDKVFDAYEQAILKQYRFFSYGDAMLIL